MSSQVGTYHLIKFRPSTATTVQQAELDRVLRGARLHNNLRTTGRKRERTCEAVKRAKGSSQIFRMERVKALVSFAAIGSNHKASAGSDSG